MVTRPDRRADNKQTRTLSASQNILSRADGSAKFEFGIKRKQTYCYLYAYIL
jgi:exosome complex component RRP46